MRRRQAPSWGPSSVLCWVVLTILCHHTLGKHESGKLLLRNAAKAGMLNEAQTHREDARRAAEQIPFNLPIPPTTILRTIRVPPVHAETPAASPGAPLLRFRATSHLATKERIMAQVKVEAQAHSKAGSKAKGEPITQDTRVPNGLGFSWAGGKGPVPPKCVP